VLLARDDRELPQPRGQRVEKMYIVDGICHNSYIGRMSGAMSTVGR
jgi:hypothetical protein